MPITLFVLGDALSIIALSIMASVSFAAWKRIEDEAKVPMKFDRQGNPSWLLSKPFALVLPVLLATGILLLPVFMKSNADVMTGEEKITLFAMRAMMSGAFAIVHLVTVKAALEYLEKNGGLRS